MTRNLTLKLYEFRAVIIIFGRIQIEIIKIKFNIWFEFTSLANSLNLVNLLIIEDNNLIKNNINIICIIISVSNILVLFNISLELHLNINTTKNIATNSVIAKNIYVHIVIIIDFIELFLYIIFILNIGGIENSNIFAIILSIFINVDTIGLIDRQIDEIIIWLFEYFSPENMLDKIAMQ